MAGALLIVLHGLQLEVRLGVLHVTVVRLGLDEESRMSAYALYNRKEWNEVAHLRRGLAVSCANGPVAVRCANHNVEGVNI